MTPRERMRTALAGEPVDRLPLAPYFWGEEYVWRLVGRPVWQLSLGPPGNWRELVAAIQARHDCDWVIPLGGGSGFLQGKTAEQREGRVLITDPASGQRWEYRLDGRRLVPLDEAGRPQAEAARTTGELHPPILTIEAADRWLEAAGYTGSGEPPADWEAGWVPETYGGRYFTAWCVGGGFHQLCYGIGFESAMVMMAQAPRVAAYMLERMMAGVPARARRLAELGFDAGFVVDSYASADIVSPDCYRDWIAPIHRAHAAAIKQAGLLAILYNTGNCLPYLPQLAAQGWDALSLEERCKGVEQDLAAIRRAVGPGLCLFANFDSYLLLAGDRARIAEETARLQHVGGPLVMGTGSPVCDATDPVVVDYWLDLVSQG